MANSYTTFPDSVQTFDLRTDVSSGVYSAWKQFNTYISNGEFANASSLLQSNSELQKCIIDSVYVNRLSKTVEEIQTIFLNEIQTYIHETVLHKGTWNASTKYTKYNFVNYTIGETVQSYECLRDDTPIGIAPTNTTYWIPRVIKGEQGAPGIGLAPRGTFSETTVYYQYDLVLYNDQLWYAIKDNPNGIPSASSTDWRLFFIFNGESIAYDNSVSGIAADTIQGAINVLSDKLNTVENGAQVNTITGVKGSAEGSYRTGNVNITPANLGITVINNTADANKRVSYATTSGACNGNSVTATNATNADMIDGYHIQISNVDLTPGVSALATNVLYFVYE